MKNVVLGGVVGFALGAGALWALTSLITDRGQINEAAEAKPLYWVAPMDPNYRRDKPGKSPMGMDLIPVYNNDASSGAAGTVIISPNVENNLGVRTAKVQLQPLHTQIKTVGYVQYDQDNLVHAHPRVSGWIEKLYVKSAGDPVQKGQPLYSLYSPELVSAQEELILALNTGNTKLVKSVESRLKALHFPAKEIAELTHTRKVQQAVMFPSPQNGVVDNLNIREGFYVTPGTTLMSIGTLDEVWVVAEVFERQASLVQVGQPVTMYLDYLPNKQWAGKVDYVYPSLDAKTRTARVRLRFKNADHLLKPNMFAEVIIHVANAENALVIPREAVIRTGSQDRVVLALGDGQFKSVAVELGRMDDNFVEILEGLEENERIVTSAQFLLDSESSKTSDFKRMDHSQNLLAPVWVEAKVEQVMAVMNMVKLTHEPIPEWDWPVMTMMFFVDDSIDMGQFETGLTLHVQIEKDADEDYVITQVHIPNGTAPHASGGAK
ncbi:efflux RND transporter periplasmic adaptor subunit [Saccharophagus degradans]|uniref:Secretion protein HlyD n=1 Tax=Saccharophagus degradans (strain 2-40 / ATCC 43961 / DSM 17024) TaxID=203122 RepID=Q21DN8_SACD2|nr:efflux RND transporter periplasmic adaptor subunit [Saccharophagus degradans]ABD83191.1 Secretion protein HlyD [Saccharophagus degradans 2-40]